MIFVPENVLEMARWARLNSPDVIKRNRTYESEKLGLRYQAFYCFDDDESDTEMMVCSTDDAVIVIYRGTEMEWKDWLVNADFVKRAVPEEWDSTGRVHNGFLKAYLCSKDDLHLEIKRLAVVDNIQTKKVYVTGHSQGAAIATLAIYDLVDAGIKVEQCAVFASPRVADPIFKISYDHLCDGLLLNVILKNDIVPRVPRRWQGFAHVGGSWYCSPEGCWDLTGEKFARDQGPITAYLNIKSFMQHFLSSYILALEELCLLRI